MFTSYRNGTDSIFKQRIDQDTAEAVVTGSLRPRFPFLSADGAWILYWENPKGATPDRFRLMRIPVSGGAPQFVLEARGLQDFGCARAPATLCAVLESSPDEGQLTLTAFDPLKGRGKALRIIHPKEYGSRELSPDGATYAISNAFEPESHIRLLSLSQGQDREITVKGWLNITGLNWSHDGKGFYCGSVSPQGGTLLYVDLKGNTRVLWQFKGGSGRLWGVPSPDGRYLAIRGDVINSNAWMLEGF